MNRQQEDNSTTVLPDGSAFFTASFPLPKGHWLYGPMDDWDDARDEFAECPEPVLAPDMRKSVMIAARYAIRAATACGTAEVYDPDALVLNLQYALCGPVGKLRITSPDSSG